MSFPLLHPLSLRQAGQYVQILQIGETFDIGNCTRKFVFAQVPVIILNFRTAPSRTPQISRYLQDSHIRQSAHDFWDGPRQLIIFQVPMNEGTL